MPLATTEAQVGVQCEDIGLVCGNVCSDSKICDFGSGNGRIPDLVFWLGLINRFLIFIYI